ncbi:hypothetical protein N781_03295 [Pontibacillus halophilus JSM 076056 = DSM 19796]|uniref:Uncharacterized protein n=1 Tax=Pontibacillus halophilus JSM 076056 = DSM 19796 TaxID=1385510 RepID=A0A0A5I6T8_9BACI|nr:UPF0223 family protein [Pontibacillus halophilus]KGX91532.1 hypothetical protein N781_03295 [Pontibacillus halophilus JSM 076056 = DSM 19796]
MSEQYNYPIDVEHWSTEEVIDVINFYHIIEKAYEEGIKRSDLMMAYTRFKQIVPSKSEEKKLGEEFQQQSGYSIYKAVKEAKQTEEEGYVKL